MLVVIFLLVVQFIVKVCIELLLKLRLIVIVIVLFYLKKWVWRNSREL